MVDGLDHLGSHVDDGGQRYNTRNTCCGSREIVEWTGCDGFAK